MTDQSPAALVPAEPSAAPKPRRRRGRPTKYSIAAVQVICDGIADGMPFKFAASLGGISADTFYDWQRRFPYFSDAVQEALAKGVHERLKCIKAAAQKGDVRAAQWWLEHVLPEDFARDRIEHAGQVAVSIESKTGEAQLQQLRDAYKERVRAEIENELMVSRSSPLNSSQQIGSRVTV